MNFGALNIDFNYLQEKNHIGNKDYFKTKFTYNNRDKTMLSFQTKRNLVTNSAEFYNLIMSILMIVYELVLFIDESFTMTQSLKLKILYSLKLH